MISKTRETKDTAKAKGILKAIDDAGFHIEDEKTGEVELLEMDFLNAFVGKSIVLSVVESTKQTISVAEPEEDEE